MRKSRRRIKKRKKSKKRIGKKGFIYKHFNSPVTHKYTKISTAIIIGIELLFLLVCTIWASFEIYMRLPEFLIRVK
jgi:hypothetical protein